MKYIFEWALPRFLWFIEKIKPEKRMTAVVLTKNQLATINSMAAKATNPDYIVIVRKKNEHTFRFVHFIKVQDGRSYQSDALSIRVDGWSPDLPQVKKEGPPDETAD